MRIAKKMSILLSAAVFLAVFTSFSTEALAEMESGDGGGSAVNLTVQQVTVQPIRAYVGDVIDVEVWIDNREDGSETTWAEVFANKKVVAKQMFQWGTPGMDRLSKLYIKWDTRGMAPGEYKVKVEAFVFHDISPFDNELALKQPVVLAAPGGEFPGGMQAGGSVTVIDERYR